MTTEIVLVTGASSGIGAAVARRYADKGARVVLVARNNARLDAVASGIRTVGGNADVYPIDLTSPEQISQSADRIVAEVGVPNIIVNNAGAGRWAPLVESSTEELRQMIEVPLLSAIYVSKSFLAPMMERRSGSIVCVSSPASYMAWRDACGYIAARRGLAGFCDGLRLETKRSRIHVGLVILGAVETPYWSNNPGSHVSIPISHRWLMPRISADDAASVIEASTAKRRGRLVKPWSFRPLMALYAASPRLTERGMRLASKYIGGSQANAPTS